MVADERGGGAGPGMTPAPSSPVSIERLGPGQGERLRHVRLRALRDSPDAFETTWATVAAFPPEEWERQLDRLATFVAVIDGRDEGLVRGAPHDHDADAGYLISMWVAPEARGRGVGSALVDAVVKWAEGRGSRRLVLDVGEANAEAVSLYASKGFVPTGAQGALPPPREHIREIQMALALERPVSSRAES